MNNNKIVTLGIGCCARIGKDSLALCLKTLLNRDGYNVGIYSLAASLKNACEEFLLTNFNYYVWTNDTNEKAKFRDFLVLFGKMHRELSQGTHWTSIVEKKIKEEANYFNGFSDKPYIAIVPDIRYDDPKFPKDEAYWIQSKMNGYLINLNRRAKGELVLPANSDESLNLPRIRERCDYDMTWNTIEGAMEFNNLNNHEIFDQVAPLYKEITLQCLGH